MGPGSSAALYALVLATAVASVAAAPEPDTPSKRPVATPVALLVVGIPSLVQLLLAPSLLAHLERNRTALGHGQLCRLVTSLVVQDGGSRAARRRPHGGGASGSRVSSSLLGSPPS